MTRAKFKVSKIETQMGSHKVKDENGKYIYNESQHSRSAVYAPCEMRTIVLNPVYGNDDPTHENSKFWDASPSGEIRLAVINPEAWKEFELDKEYYVDFTKV